MCLRSLQPELFLTHMQGCSIASMSIKLAITVKKGQKYTNVKILVSDMKIKSQPNSDGVNKCRSK